MTQLAEVPTKKPARGDVAADYRDAFAAFAEGAPGPDWLGDLRESALRAFEQQGMPHPRQEAWRYTKHRAVTGRAFSPVERPGDAAAMVKEYGFAKQAAAEVVVVDGVFDAELSTFGDAGDVKVVNLLTAADEHADVVQQHLARHASVEKHPFTALNTAFLRGGVFVHVPDDATLDLPIHLLFVSTAEGEGEFVACPRTLVVAGDRCAFTVVQSYVGPQDRKYFTNAVTEIVAGADCKIDHNKLNAEGRAAYHVSVLEASVGPRTELLDHNCTIGGLMTRNDVNVHLDGPAASCILNGVVLLDGEQHCDNHTLLDHQHPDCPTYELYKHVLDDRATGLFKGQIYVAQIAQKTDSKQNSRTLLLSDAAQMMSQPALEIYADDVKCTHGSTTGPLDEGAVFYLNSRGVSTEMSRRLLTYAFAADVTRRIKVAPLRQRVEDYMAKQHGLPTDFRIQDLASATEDVVF